MTACSVSGCSAPIAGDPRFGRYCTSHRARLRRHGDPAQRTITKTDLKPYLESIERRIKRQPQAKAWGVVEARWRVLVDSCREDRAEAMRQRVIIRHRWRAQEELLKIADSAPAPDVWKRPVAMFMLREAEPRAFASDRGFRFELVRLTRQLTDMNVGTSWDSKAGRVKRFYRDLPPRSAELIGEWLAEVFGAPGLSLARLDKEALARKAKAAIEWNEAIEELSGDGQDE